MPDPSNPYASPSAGTVNPRWALTVVGLITGMYALSCSCCSLTSLPILAAGGDPQASSVDLALAVACTLGVMASAIPAFAALFQTRWAGLSHLVWGSVMLTLEAAASISYVITHESPWLAVGMSVVLYVTWPACCVIWPLVTGAWNPARQASS